MKKLYPVFFMIFILIFISCSDPIFFNISLEEEILEPIINGSPTNFTMFKGQMYVASGMTLYKYIGHFQNRKDRGNWQNSNPGGRILMIAATDDYLFALCEDYVKENGKDVLKILLKKSSNPGSSSFSNVTSNIGQRNYRILSVYGVNNRLFMGAWAETETGKISINDIYGSLYILCADQNGDNQVILEGTDTKLLNGAEYNNSDYYLSTIDLKADSGCIYISDLTPGNTKAHYNDIPFAGIINLKDNNNTIVAISSKGILYNVISKSGTGRNFGEHLATGALAIYERNGVKRLLAGRQNNINTSVNSGYTYGYLELELDDNGISGNEFKEPGLDFNSSMPQLDNRPGENGRYKSSIGKISINHIFQCPGSYNDERILFVSTQKNGIWSYRNRRGSDSEWYWYWNTEQ